MKPVDLYSLKPIKVDNDIDQLDSHMAEVDFFVIDAEEDKRIELRYYADEYMDGIRGWALFSVWFDGSPVMVCQEAGRDNEDHTKKYITDIDKYIELTRYLFSLYNYSELVPEDIHDPEKDIKDLTSFYGGSL